MYELISWHPVQPQEITAETYLRLPIDLKLLYRRKVSATVQPPDREEKEDHYMPNPVSRPEEYDRWWKKREEKAYYPFTDDANRTDDPEAPYKQKNSKL